jgi:hypothetical protein
LKSERSQNEIPWVKSLARVPVHEVFQGQTAWQGTVEVFNLTGHSKAKRAYAWQYQDDPNEIKTIVVLEIPPVDSPQSAVKVAIASKARK